MECRICSPLSDEWDIKLALERKLPLLRWQEGDSSWDKVRVWGEGSETSITVYRYESPGPFQLTIDLERQEADCERASQELRDQVVEALNGWIWKPLEPQPVTLIQPQGRFPAAYEFECDCSLEDIQRTLENADFWFWESIRRPPEGICLKGRIPFRQDGQPLAAAKERVWILGERPDFRIEVGHWVDEPGRIPSCAQVHEWVQNTILPAIGAYRVRAAA